MLDFLPFIAAWNLHKRHRKLYQEPIWRRYRTLAVLLAVTGLVSAVRFVSEVVNFLDECSRNQLLHVSPWPRYVDFLVYAVTLVLALRYLRQQRDPAGA
jgi:hypothetical protein